MNYCKTCNLLLPMGLDVRCPDCVSFPALREVWHSSLPAFFRWATQGPSPRLPLHFNDIQLVAMAREVYTEIYRFNFTKECLGRTFQVNLSVPWEDRRSMAEICIEAEIRFPNVRT